VEICSGFVADQVQPFFRISSSESGQADTQKCDDFQPPPSARCDFHRTTRRVELRHAMAFGTDFIGKKYL
jgi:hypothetical protein